MISSLLLVLATTQTAQLDLAHLSWLTGSWYSENGRVEEHWTTPRDGLMVGMHRNLDRGAFFEYLRIEATDQGVVYVSQPKDRDESRFQLIEMQPNRVRFEHLQNKSVLSYFQEEPGGFCASLQFTEGEQFDWCWTREPPEDPASSDR